MRTICYAIIVVLIAILPMSCRRGGPWSVNGHGSNVNEIRPIKGFHGIKLCIDAEVNYSRDSVYFVEINAQPNILRVIDTKIEHGILRIDANRNFRHTNRIVITIHSPHMDHLSVNGNGSIMSAHILSDPKLELFISGAGRIGVSTVSVQSLVSRISGAGIVEVNQGDAQNEDVSVNGAGSIRAEFVKAVNANATISGAGSIILTVNTKLNVDISGSGVMKYHGQPTVTADISGAGKVIALD